MNIVVLILNIAMPIIMILIGVLYKCNLYKKVEKTLDLIVPIAVIFSGLSEEKKDRHPKNTDMIALANRKCSLIWSISGIGTLLIAIIVLILNKAEIYNISIILLEVQCAILVAVFVTVEYILRNRYYKDINIKN